MKQNQNQSFCIGQNPNNTSPKRQRVNEPKVFVVPPLGGMQHARLQMQSVLLFGLAITVLSCLTCSTMLAAATPVQEPAADAAVVPDQIENPSADNPKPENPKPDNPSTQQTPDDQQPVTAQPEQPAEPEQAAEPEQPFKPDFDDQDLAETRNRAWEYRPYHVAVWFCLDGSPALNSVYQQVALDVTRRSELLDPSGWDLTTGLAPSKWRYRFNNYLERPEKLADLADVKSLQTYDKLIIVCINSEIGQTAVRIREFDITTQQWGPLVERNLAQLSNLGRSVMDGIVGAFMPIAKIDRIDEISYEDEKGKPRIRDEVVMQIRGIQSCVRTRRELRSTGAKTFSDDDPESDTATDSAQPIPPESGSPTSDESAEQRQAQEYKFEWISEPTQGSPVYVRDQDRMLPVIRRTDRKGNLVKLEPIEFTFLTVDEQDGPVLKASIESYHRAPLAQRKSKRAQKLALVIRPPKNSTTLFLYAPDKENSPLEGFEIWSRRPGSTVDEKSEFLGKTNWRGGFDIPPSPEGLRIIYVKRGNRALRRLPVIPGLYESVSTRLPNDETRLFAEGVIQGLQNEMLSLVIRREVFETEIEAAIEADDAQAAKAALKQLQDLETPNDFKNRMSEDESLLKIQTSDARELQYINLMFDTLRKLLTAQESKSRQNEFTEKVLKMTEGN